MLRLDEPGWVQIGKVDSAGRRALWSRITYDRSLKDRPHDDTAVKIELCSGREGDDAYVAYSKDDPKFRLLLDVIERAESAADRDGW